MNQSARFVLESAWLLGQALAHLPGTGTTGKNRVKDAVNQVFLRAEQGGIIEPLDGVFDEAYSDYPELRIFEQEYAAIRRECEQALRFRSLIPDVASLGAGYGAGAVDDARWKGLVLKAGDMVHDNTRLCPRTAELVARLPQVYSACLSILEPGQYVTPHWGYFRGFVRFHLGVVIPYDNQAQQCWLRLPPVHARRSANEDARDGGKRYFWRNGRGMIFDDTQLHDAYNGSDRVRVVLWLDVLRKLPPPLAAYRDACLRAAALEPAMRRVRTQAVVHAARPQGVLAQR